MVLLSCTDTAAVGCPEPPARRRHPWWAGRFRAAACGRPQATARANSASIAIISIAIIDMIIAIRITAISIMFFFVFLILLLVIHARANLRAKSRVGLPAAGCEIGALARSRGQGS